MRFESLELEMRSLKHGEHIASIYRNREEQFSVAVPFIVAGLKNGEKCVYIVDENTKKDVIASFREFFDIDQHMATGQFELLTGNDTYLKDGFFDPDRMLETLKQSEKKALKDGYRGSRFTGEMTWVFTNLRGVEKLIEYEAKLNYLFPSSKSIGICQYNEGKFSPEILLNVIHTHPRLFIHGTLCKNPYYLPPEEFFSRIKGEVSWNIYERTRNNILEKKKIEDKVRKDEIERNLILESMSEPVLYFEREKRLKWMNRAAASFFEVKPEKALGKTCEKFLPRSSAAYPMEMTWESGAYEEGEISLPNGKYGYVKASPVYEGSEIVGVVAVVEDITERKCMEMQLKNLFEVSRQINSTFDMQEIFESVSDYVQKLVGFDKFVVFLISEDGKTVYTAYASGGIKDLTQSLLLYHGNELISHCTQTGETALIENAPAERGEGGMKSQVAVPLLIEETCAGILYLAKSAPHAYTYKDVSVLKPLSEVVSSALRNSQLQKEIKAFSQELMKRVEEKSKRTEILLSVKQALQAELSWEKGLVTIADSVGSLGLDRCAVFLVNPSKKVLEFHYGKDIQLKEAAIPLNSTEYAGVRCIREKKTILSTGKRLFEAEPFVWVPVVIQDEAFAAIAADNQKTGKQIKEEDIKDLEILAGMCAAFIDRTKRLVEPVSEKMLRTELKYNLNPAECYIILEKKPEKTFDIFVDLVTHGVPGLVFSREYPEKLRRKYMLARTPIMWLSRFEQENTLSPDDLPKLTYMVKSFVKKCGESVIVLDGLEYLIAQGSFSSVLKCIYELTDIVVTYNARLIVSLYKDALSPEDYVYLERELTVLDPETLERRKQEDV